MNAARTIRRLPAEAVPALIEAVGEHRDEFVRYRAFVLLSSFDDAARRLCADCSVIANDRLREVAYKWLEGHPDPAMVHAPERAAVPERRSSCGPPLFRALAALRQRRACQRALITEIGRGFDFFRGAVIDALGRRRAAYAVDAIARRQAAGSASG